VASRRTYTYLPNGQLGSVESLSSSPSRNYQVRYDEEGHPVTISEYFGTSLYNTYELFWLGDRLISTKIDFAAPRPYPTATPCLSSSGCFTYTSIRWHYHYLGDVLVSATRERVHTDGSVWTRDFYFLTDERGLIHRVVDSQGATWWQAHWDAQGVRTHVGRPQPEMWIPFALPGQILLGDYESEVFQNVGVRTAGTEASIKPAALSASASSVESFTYSASNAADKNLATRWASAFSDPQWLTVDLGAVKPISGVRLTWETAYANGYRIEVSNSSSGPWTSMFSTTTGNGGVDEILLSTSARYVRMYGTQRATAWGYSLWEFEVFGPWTRAPIALNNWRAYDPLTGNFLQPDSMDTFGRADPEGYQYARALATHLADRSGLSTNAVWAVDPGRIGKGCMEGEQARISVAMTHALTQLNKCTAGPCDGEDGGVFRRLWLYGLRVASWECPDKRSDLPLSDQENFFVNKYNLFERFDSGAYASAFGNRRKRLDETVYHLSPYKLGRRPLGTLPGFRGCLAGTLAHEVLHQIIHRGIRWYPDGPVTYEKEILEDASIEDAMEVEEKWVHEAVKECKICP
jgi:hypothetical protein